MPYILVFILFLSGNCFSNIPAEDYVNTSIPIKKGYEVYNPVLGAVAIQAGIAYNIRFLGPYAQGKDPEGKPNYLKDSSDEPVWNVTKILFPSIAGNLSIHANRNDNIARVTHDPQSVAILLSFIHEVRNGKAPQTAKSKEKYLTEWRKKLLNPNSGLGC